MLTRYCIYLARQKVTHKEFVFNFSRTRYDVKFCIVTLHIDFVANLESLFIHRIDKIVLILVMTL